MGIGGGSHLIRGSSQNAPSPEHCPQARRRAWLGLQVRSGSLALSAQWTERSPKVSKGPETPTTVFCFRGLGRSQSSERGLKEYESPPITAFPHSSNFDDSNLVSMPMLSCPQEESEHQISLAICQRHPRSHARGKEVPCYIPVRKTGRETWPPASGTLLSAPSSYALGPSSYALGLPESFQHLLAMFIQPRLGQWKLDCGLFPTRRNILRGGQGEQDTRFYWGVGVRLTGQAAENLTKADEPLAL